MRPVAVLQIRALVGASLVMTLLTGCGSPGSEQPRPAAAPVAQPAPTSTDELLDDTLTLARVPPSVPERLGYAGPASAAAGPTDQLVGQEPARVFDQVQSALRDAGLRISHLDERNGVIAASYTGEPARFVDCGTITAQAINGEVRRLEAAADAMSFRRGERRNSHVVERDLVLNARLVLQMQPEGEGTRLRTSATYVVSKQTNVAGEPRTETIAFESGGRGSFAKGTICQPTGGLERLALVSARS